MSHHTTKKPISSPWCWPICICLSNTRKWLLHLSLIQPQHDWHTKTRGMCQHYTSKLAQANCVLSLSLATLHHSSRFVLFFCCVCVCVCVCVHNHKLEITTLIKKRFNLSSLCAERCWHCLPSLCNRRDKKSLALLMMHHHKQLSHVNRRDKKSQRHTDHHRRIVQNGTQQSLWVRLIINWVRY